MRHGRPTRRVAIFVGAAVVLVGGVTAGLLAVAGGSAASSSAAGSAVPRGAGAASGVSASPTGALSLAYVAPPAAKNVTATPTAKPGTTLPPRSRARVSPAAAAAPPSVGFDDTPTLGVVLSNPAGQTLYWYDGESAANITCTGSCTSTWTPYLIPPGATVHAPPGGLPGVLSAIARPGGGLQVTYQGHPLYLYKGDHGPATTTGDGLSGSAGRWHAEEIRH